MPINAKKVNLTPEQVVFLKKIVEFFRMYGWSIWAGFGIAANMFAECAFNPRLYGDGGKAYGLCQWHPDRRAVFRQVFGITMEDADVQKQLEFVLHELRKGQEKKAGRLLSGAKSAREAAAIFSRYYERPRLADAEAEARAALAQRFHDLYTTELSPSPDSPLSA